MCGAVDRIVVEGDFDDRERRCVECNFLESISARADVPESGVTTRVDTSSSAVADVIRFVVDTKSVRSSD
jgi:hypothetical protein